MDDRCQEIEALLPSYALGALEEPERRSVAAHLKDCPGCSSRLAQYRQASLGLLHGAGSVRPPEELRARLLDLIGPPVQPRASLRERLRRPSALRLATLAILLLLATNMVLFLQNLGLRRAQVAQTEQLRVSEAVMALVADPSSETAYVPGETLWGQFMYDPERPIAVLCAWGLERLPAGQAYQAWLVLPDGGRVSAGVFSPSLDSPYTWVLVRSSQPLSGFVGFGVTVEPEGGSPDPTGPSVLRFDL